MNSYWIMVLIERLQILHTRRESNGARFFTIIEETSLRCQPSSTPSLPLTTGGGGWWWLVHGGWWGRGGGSGDDWRLRLIVNVFRPRGPNEDISEKK